MLGAWLGVRMEQRREEEPGIGVRSLWVPVQALRLTMRVLLPL